MKNNTGALSGSERGDRFAASGEAAGGRRQCHPGRGTGCATSCDANHARHSPDRHTRARIRIRPGHAAAKVLVRKSDRTGLSGCRGARLVLPGEYMRQVSQRALAASEWRHRPSLILDPTSRGGDKPTRRSSGVQQEFRQAQTDVRSSDTDSWAAVRFVTAVEAPDGLPVGGTTPAAPANSGGWARGHGMANAS
jgi:hypothetical protein